MRIISSDLRIGNEVSKNVQKNKVFGNADPHVKLNIMYTLIIYVELLAAMVAACRCDLRIQRISPHCGFKMENDPHCGSAFLDPVKKCHD